MIFMGLFFFNKRSKNPPPARLVMIIHFNDMNDYPSICTELEKYFGKIDYETSSFRDDSPAITKPGYDVDSPLRLIKIISFSKPVGREELVSIQLKSLKIEKKTNRMGIQKITIRPGYVTDSVAIGSYIEEHFHRIYLFSGVYAQIWYKTDKMSFVPLDHTPLFMLQKSVITAFNDIRLILISD